jgi:hypothetical protein
MSRSAIRASSLLALCAFALTGCDRTYFADPITATVVDAETKQPLEGVVVAAHWEMKGGIERGNVSGEVMVMEAATDSAGTFHFSAWGPVKVHVGFWSNANLTNDTPEMILFKSGYKIGIKANTTTAENIYGVGPHLSSDWNGKIIEMKKFVGALDQYENHVHDFFEGYAFAGHCNWQKIPRMLIAIRDQTRIFKKAHIAGGNFYTELVNNGGYGCGSVDEFLDEYEK